MRLHHVLLVVCAIVILFAAVLTYLGGATCPWWAEHDIKCWIVVRVLLPMGWAGVLTALVLLWLFAGKLAAVNVK